MQKALAHPAQLQSFRYYWKVKPVCAGTLWMNYHCLNLLFPSIWKSSKQQDWSKEILKELLFVIASMKKNGECKALFEWIVWQLSDIRQLVLLIFFWTFYRHITIINYKFHSNGNYRKSERTCKAKYSEIALQDKSINQSSCCGAGGCSTEVYNIMSDDYTQMQGYHADADLGLGCGLPTQFAHIKKGDTVIDLGSGAGNDCFIARSETGPDGRVIGIDFTPAMIEKARINAEN